MADKKRQHYVPRFYLKNFSINSEKKAIGIYNVERNKFIATGSLKDQAYRDYYYGEDKVIENFLSVIESVASTTIRDITEKESIPTKMDYTTLLFFAVIQWARTPYTTDEHREIIEKNMESTAKLDKRYQSALDEIKSKLKKPSVHLFRNAIMTYPLLLDLPFALLLNQTNIPFITSDNPVVLYNQFLEEKREYSSNTGWESKGLQIFLPLSQKICVLFCDKSVYNFKSAQYRTINLKKTKDVDSLNQLQCINSYNNLYFNEKITNDYATGIFKEIRKYRRKSKFTHYESPIRIGPDGKPRILHFTHRNDVKINLKLSFISIKKSAKRSKIGDRALIIRNKWLFELHEQFTTLVEKGIYEPVPEQFKDFLMDTYSINDLTQLNAFRT